jgi:hypothetical protein
MQKYAQQKDIITCHFCSLLNDTASNSGYIMLNDWMTVNNELERIEKEAFMAQCKVLCCHLPGGTEKRHEKSVIMVCVPAKIENKHLQNTRSVAVSGNMLGTITCKINI